MNVTHHPMVIHSRAKYGMTMSKDKKAVLRTRSHVKNPIILTLRSKVNAILGSWMFLTHCLIVLDPCAKYNMLMSKQTKVAGGTGRHVKNPINLTLRSKVNVVSGLECMRHIVSWWYTHVLYMVCYCHSKKKLWARNESAERWTNRWRGKQTVIPIYPTELCLQGV